MIELFDSLSLDVTSWIVDNGNERRLMENETLIAEGQELDALYIVLEGLFGVYLTSAGNREIAVCGAGSILGEMSFVDESPTWASVVAKETSLVLEIPRSELSQKIMDDPDFAASFYEALSRTLAQRLRRTTWQVLGTGPDRSYGIVKNETVTRAEALLGDFKRAAAEADQQLNKEESLTEEGYQELLGMFVSLLDTCHDILGPESEVGEQLKAEIAIRLRSEMVPYILLTETAERFYSKPRGYAGDFMTIDMIYRDSPAGTGRLGPVLDRMHLATPPVRAVQNRRELMVEEIMKTVQSKGGKAVNIMSMACGPARELFDAYERISDTKLIKATLLDIDLQALAFVDELSRKKRIRSQISLLNENLVYLALGRRKSEVPPQDLVYSIGLIDYFSDKLVVRLLNYVHDILAGGGRAIVGNFHPGNTTKEYMDSVLEWRLIHRTEEDMNRLFRDSAFNRPCTQIRFENEKINLFAECVKKDG